MAADPACMAARIPVFLSRHPINTGHFMASVVTRLLTVFFVAFVATSAGAASRTDTSRTTLSEISSNWVGKEIVIRDPRVGGTGADLLFWHIARESSPDHYAMQISKSAPGSLLGEKAVIVAVEEAGTERSVPGKLDAFGKPLAQRVGHDLYIQITAKVVADPTVLIASTTFYRGTPVNLFQFSDRADSIAREVDAYIAKLIGTRIYKVGYTKLLKPALSVEELAQSDIRDRNTLFGVDNMTPLKVVDGKVLFGAAAVILKVELPTGGAAILYGQLDNYDNAPGYKRTNLERIDISAIERLPAKLTPREVAAIKAGSIFRGMSEDALYITLGLPEKTNDWGAGGEQWIYPGSMYIYVRNRAVVDWQHTER